MPRENRHEWLAEPLLGIEGAFIRTMFGCRSVYGRGMLLLVLADGDEPWNGALFPVEKKKQAEVLAKWPMLSPHPVLPKWLYLREAEDDFEGIAQQLVQEIAQGNPLLGVVPPKKSRKKKTAKKATDTTTTTKSRRRIPIAEGESDPPPPPDDETLKQMPPHLR